MFCFVKNYMRKILKGFLQALAHSAAYHLDSIKDADALLDRREFQESRMHTEPD